MVGVCCLKFNIPELFYYPSILIVLLFGVVDLYLFKSLIETLISDYDGVFLLSFLAVDLESKDFYKWEELFAAFIKLDDYIVL